MRGAFLLMLASVDGFIRGVTAGWVVLRENQPMAKTGTRGRAEQLMFVAVGDDR